MNIRNVCLAVLAGAVLAGCEKKEAATSPATSESAKAEDVMAVSVNGEKLMKSQIDADVEKVVKAQGDRIPAEQLELAKEQIGNQLVQTFIVQKVLLAHAKAEGYVATDADRKAREDEFLKTMALRPDAPKSAEEFFAKHPLGVDRAREEFEAGIVIDKMMKSEFAKSEKKDFSEEARKLVDGIVSNNVTAAAEDAAALEKIKGLKAQLDQVPAGEVAAKFAELAKAESACPSSEKGGDLEEFGRGMMVPEFDKVAFELPVGKVSDPVKTKFGYHLIMVTKKIPAVEAKDGAAAEGEKVRASHILVKGGMVNDVPKVEDVVKRLERQGERVFMQSFMMKLVRAADIQTSEAYKMFLPPPEKPESAETVEKPAGK